MKQALLTFSLLAVFILSGLTSFAQDLSGAWHLQGDENNLLLIQDNYFSWTETNDNDEFLNTLGGPMEIENVDLSVRLDFNSGDTHLVGNSFTLPYELDGNQLKVQHPEGYTLNWERIPETDQGLAGLWRITSRQSDGEMHSIPKRARVTYKLLTPQYFQWMAINTETGEFFGTGGGKYTFKDGKYTEHIEFFSRDNSRVGASLEFDGEVKGGDWHHSGKSSKGDPIYEIWSRDRE